MVSDTIDYAYIKIETEPHTKLEAELIEFFGGVLLAKSLEEIILIYCNGRHGLRWACWLSIKQMNRGC